MYDEDLATLMRSATSELSPPDGAAARALKAASVSRRRSTYLAAGGGLAVLSVVAVGATQVRPRMERVQFGAEPPTTAAATAVASASPASDAGCGPTIITPAHPSQYPGAMDQPTTHPDDAFAQLTLPDTLPGFPVNLWNDPAAQSYQYTSERLWGWNTGPYVKSPGAALRLDVRDAPDCFPVDGHGQIEGRDIDGARQVRGLTALVSHDTDQWLDLSTAKYSIEVQGADGATVDDLVLAVNAIQGLDAPAVPTASLTPPTSPVPLDSYKPTADPTS